MRDFGLAAADLAAQVWHDNRGVGRELSDVAHTYLG